MPFQVLGIWFRGLLSLLLIGAGIYLLVEWYQRTDGADVRAVRPRPAVAAADEKARRETDLSTPAQSRWYLGWDRETAMLLGGLALVLWSCGGGWSTILLRRSDAP